MQNYKQILAFLAVAENNSFNRAATKLSLSTMAVSKQIKNLEETINEQLFHRTTRHVELSEFGESFYQQCKELEKHWQDVTDFIESHRIEPQGKLTVVCSHALGQEHLLSRIEEFYELYPKIQLEIHLTEEPTLHFLQDLSADILFGFAELPTITDGLRHRSLYPVKNMLYASPKFIEEFGQPKSAEDLINYKFITHALRQPDNIIKLKRDEQVITSKPTLIMNSFLALMRACADGVGIFLGADVLAEPYLEKGELVEVLPDLPYRCYNMQLFYRATNYEQPAMRAFVDFYSKLEKTEE